MRRKPFKSLLFVVAVVLIGVVLGGCKRSGFGQDPLPADTSMAMPTPAPTLAATAMATALPEIVYTSDSNPCPRSLPERGGGAGQDPLPVFVPNEAVLMILEGHTKPVTSASFSADGKTIVTSDGVDVRLWDATSGKLIDTFSHEAGLSAPNLSPNGQMVAAAVGDGTVRLYDTKTGVAFQVLTPSLESDISPCVFGKRQLSTPVFSPDGQIIVTVDGCVAQLWDVATGKEVRDVATGKEIRLIGEVLPDTSEILIQNGHADSIYDIAFSPNGQVLVTAGGDWSVRMWNVATGEHLRCFQVDGVDYLPSFWSVAFSPDGRTVASGSEAVFLWDTSTSQIIHSFYADQAKTVAFSPDGQTLVTASVSSQDSTLRRAWLWDVNTGQPTGLMKHPRQVHAAVFSPDGQTILTAIGEWEGEDPVDPIYAAWVWDANSEVLAREAFTTKKIEGLFEQGQTLAQAGEIEAALAVYAQAQIYDPDVAIDADDWNSLCWNGSLYGHAAEVLFACEKAVELEPDDGDIRDSRGLALALTGDYAKAIEDFKFYVKQVGDSEREAWIAALEAGENPFTPEVLEALRN